MTERMLELHCKQLRAHFPFSLSLSTSLSLSLLCCVFIAHFQFAFAFFCGVTSFSLHCIDAMRKKRQLQSVCREVGGVAGMLTTLGICLRCLIATETSVNDVVGPA